MDNAKNAKIEYVNLYWAGVFILVFIGLVGLTFYGIRRSKPSLVVGVLIVLVIATIVGGITITMEEPETEEEPDWTYHGVASSTDADKHKDDQGNKTDAGGGDGEGWEDGEEWRDTDGDGLPMNKADEINDFTPAPPKILPNDVDNDGYVDDWEDSSGTDPLDPGAKREEREVHVREWFPETWYWNPVLITDEYGTAEVELTTPDSITTWEIKAVASTKDAKLGVENQNLTVFQQFFIEPDIPVSVIRNDTFPLRIMVYNYDEVEREITVYLEEDDWFSALDETTKKVTVPSDNVSKVMFNIKALKVGEHNVTVSGYNGKAWDDVIKPMRVDPDGKRVSQTFNGKLSDNQTIKETIIKSSDRVADSENAFIKLQGGMEAVLLDGAETFIRHVSGCGEQSMSSLNIDILAFDTVQKLGTATEEKMFEYEHIVTQGIQHELQYLLNAKNGKGRGIVWFPSDDDVHQWLTSWGLITFQDAIDAGFDIDSNIITDMQTWLLSQQESDGSFVFPERGLYEFTNPILRSKTVSCSAYITRSLIYSGFSPSSTAIQKAVTYIEDHAKDDEVWNDPYTLSLVLIVLEDGNGGSTLRNQLASRLDELKNVDEEKDIAWWDSGTSMITDSDYGYYGYGSNYHTIETTGYAVMALARSKGPMHSTVQRGIKYLIENRQGLGGWYSTQDTVVAFQALKEAGTNNIDELTVEIFADGSEISQLEFDENNIDLTYLVDLRPHLDENTEISIKSTGRGAIMYQIYYEEYIPWDIIGADKPQELILDITYDTTNIKVNDKIKASLELKYMGQADHIKMVLIDLRAPVGFSFVEEDFKSMMSNNDISQYEINNRQVYIYIEDLSYGQSITLVYHLLANDPIRGTIQGVQAYDMYNPDLTTELEPVEVTATK
jgi:CD109 antigen